MFYTAIRIQATSSSWTSIIPRFNTSVSIPRVVCIYRYLHLWSHIIIWRCESGGYIQTDKFTADWNTMDHSTFHATHNLRLCVWIGRWKMRKDPKYIRTDISLWIMPYHKSLYGVLLPSSDFVNNSKPFSKPYFKFSGYMLPEFI